jgi:GDPmannose 4,6-dehydratase
MKRSLVTGASGQAGSYLCEHLLTLGREVFAMVRRNTSFIPEKSFLADCLSNNNFHLVKGDVTDPFSLEQLCEDVHPHELYNCAAQSHVGESWRYPLQTVDATGKGALNCLEILRKTSPSCRFVQFSSSEMFGLARQVPQNEDTPFYPRSPYGCAKTFAHHMTVNYRESYDMFACSAILFNMESPRRGSDFVTQKIAQSVARIRKQLDDGSEVTPLMLGNVQAKRDWNDVRYSMAMVVKMLERDTPEDYVIGSGKTNKVITFLLQALNVAGIKITSADEDERLWHGEHLIVAIDQKLKRPAEVPLLIADAAKAKHDLGYEPDLKDFSDLVKEMVQAAMNSHGVLQSA